MQAVFAPDLEPAFRWLSVLSLLALAGIALAVYSYGKRRFRLRPLGQLLGPLLVLFAGGGAGFVAWDISRMPTVAVRDHYAIIAADTIRPTDIRKAYLEPVSVGNNRGQATIHELGVIEFADGHQQLFGSEEYDTRGLVEALRVMMKTPE